ncbi:hypothetical protein CEXT_225321 [Caerostris extrusa]|uniref:Uncharacterized protein n=1 Tax=Caerostris extrusa TaxID=172846 RepID=A0AAV4NDM8_CAEEX|nr:hypothetical protein CEXT_225321 [Caerostris extrusa]
MAKAYKGVVNHENTAAKKTIVMVKTVEYVACCMVMAKESVSLVAMVVVKAVFSVELHAVDKCHRRSEGCHGLPIDDGVPWSQTQQSDGE